MKRKSPHTQPKTENSVRDGAPRYHRFSRVIKWSLGILGGVLAFIVLAICVATWMLTPSRLTTLINREASEYLDADVRVSNARFTFWSTFPHFCIYTDSITIDSRHLDRQPADIIRRLPADSRRLATSGGLEGGINILKFISGRYLLRDVKVKGLHLNLVAYNDTINNFDILPNDMEVSEKVPYISANYIALTAPSDFRYYSAATGTHAQAALKKVSVTRIPQKKNTYRLSIPGKISATVDSLHVLHDFPFELDGMVNLSFSPFSCRFSDYTVNLGNTHGKLNLDFQAGDNMRINDMNYRISTFNVMRLLSYLPIENLPQIDDVAADIDLNVSARLTTPYRFSSTTLPSLNVDFNVAPGNVDFTTEGNTPVRLAHSGVTAEFVFNGLNPKQSHIDILPFTIAGFGTECVVAGSINRLMGSPLITARLHADSDLSGISKALGINVLKGASGNITLNTEACCELSEFSTSALAEGVKNLNLEGNINFRNLRYSLPGGERVYARNANVRFGGNAGSLGAGGLTNPVMSGRVAVDYLTFSSKADSLSANVRNLSLDGDFKSTASRADAPDVALLIKASAISLTHPDIEGKAQDISLNLNYSRRNVAVKVKSAFCDSPTSEEDSITLTIASHTPEYLSLTLPPALRNIVAHTTLQSRIRARNAVVKTPLFPVENILSDIDIEASPDSVRINSLALRSQSTAMRLKGSVSNLRSFLTSTMPEQLSVNLDLALDTVNINQLARAYESGIALRKGVEATYNLPKTDTLQSSDTISLILPRNIKAHIHATAMQTVYTHLHLYNLATDLSIAGGDMNVDNLHIDSDFGHAALNMTYHTSDMQRMGAEIEAAVTDVELVNFFKNFHTLLLMMPEMKNLEGTLGVTAKASVDIFPDMYVNIPSLHADVNVKGRGLTVHQNRFIRRITRMMMIHTSSDIHIANMDVNAEMHDNLLQLYPFNFEFDQYKLRMVGSNNFDGKLYYHIGILDWPLHIPFGINILGEFHHPLVHFGGPTYKVRKGEEVTSSIMEFNRLNIVKESRRYMKEFIEKAAESDNTPAGAYVYQIPDYRTARAAARATASE